ncbi:MAG: hypothetical protein PHE29_12405 [Tissierellia bacterium]|nr:hypothetical protein [Tissierellia bacterium]MDD4779060.1 hypothetical protein [Tissierellia bacterium]
MTIQNLNDIYKYLNTKFPVNDCIFKDKNEKAIYNSHTQYLCFIIDKRFNNEANIKIMKPYLWIGNESNIEDFKDEIGYGWIDESGNYIDNYENPIHGNCDDWFVIGFIEYKNNNDAELWNLLISD